MGRHENQAVVDEQPFRVLPRGWFVVRFANQLEAGDVVPLDYFDARTVLFRTESGQIAVLDAYCPHLGADIGDGGRVSGECIECPFHGWRFATDGSCAHIPRGKVAEGRARLRRWPAVERNGLIFVYHDPAGRDPEYEIPEISEYGRAGWLGWQGATTRRIAAHSADIVENMADLDHFWHLHQMDTTYEETALTCDEHTACLRASGKFLPPIANESMQLTFKYLSTYYGPGYEITRYDGSPANYILVAHTPVTARCVDFRYGVICPELASEEETRR